MQQVGVDGETRRKPGYKVAIMADTILIYTESHPRGFKISLYLREPTIRELLKQVQMLIPDNLASTATLAAYKESRRSTQKTKLPRVTAYDPPLPRPLGRLNQSVLPMEEADMVLPATEHHTLPPPPTGAVQGVDPHRGLRADDGMSRGLGMGTVHRPGVRGFHNGPKPAS